MARQGCLDTRGGVTQGGGEFDTAKAIVEIGSSGEVASVVVPTRMSGVHRVPAPVNMADVESRAADARGEVWRTARRIDSPPCGVPASPAGGCVAKARRIRRRAIPRASSNGGDGAAHERRARAGTVCRWRRHADEIQRASRVSRRRSARPMPGVQVDNRFKLRPRRAVTIRGSRRSRAVGVRGGASCSDGIP